MLGGLGVKFHFLDFKFLIFVLSLSKLWFLVLLVSVSHRVPFFFCDGAKGVMYQRRVEGTQGIGV